MLSSPNLCYGGGIPKVGPIVDLIDAAYVDVKLSVTFGELVAVKSPFKGSEATNQLNSSSLNFVMLGWCSRRLVRGLPAAVEGVTLSRERDSELNRQALCNRKSLVIFCWLNRI